MSMFSSIRKAASSVAAAATNNTPGGEDHEEDSDESNVLADASRVDLLQRIQDVTERNERLERRFRDVVGAYKNVLTEKAALEDTVSALTSGSKDSGSGEDSSSTEKDSATDKTASHREGDDNGTDSSEHEDDKSASTAELEALKRKVESLGRAVATLTDEKKTMQQRFQSDKKIVAENHRSAIQELEESHNSAVKKLTETLEVEKTEKEAQLAAVNQLSEQLCAGHEADKRREQEWERERQAHKKELESRLQQLKADGESSKKLFDLKDELQLARDAELDALTQLSSTSAELKGKISSLEEELASATKQLVAAESTGDSAQVLELKNETSRLQKKCADWQQRAESAEAERDEAARAAQERIAESDAKLATYLEAADTNETEAVQKRVEQENRLGELAAIVGQYEAARISDSEKITELEEEVLELRRQNKSGVLQSSESNTDEISRNTISRREEALESQVVKLKSMLDMANQQLAEADRTSVEIGQAASVDIPTPSWFGNSSSPVESANGLVSKDKARGEAEMYYRKAQALHAELTRNKAELSRISESEREVSAKLQKLIKSHDVEIQETVKQLSTDSNNLREQLRVQEVTLTAEHNKTVEDLRAKTLKMRDTALGLVRDRDVEIARLRHQLKMQPEDSSNLTPEEELASGEVSIRKLSAGVRSNRRTVHDVLGQQFGNKEIAASRTKIRELEGTILDMQEASNKLGEQTNVLKEEIRRLERNARREGANLEYLKNVIVNYMSNRVGKEQSILAIATILQFSPQELNDVRSAESATESTLSVSGWWPTSPRK